MAFPAAWRPIKVDDLVRIGNKHDGGYVVSRRSLEKTKVLVGFGLFDEWLFELDLAGRRKDLRIFSFDHTVDGKLLRNRFFREVGKIVLRDPRRNLRKTLAIVQYPLFFDGKQRKHIRQMIGDQKENCVDLRMVFSMIGPVSDQSVFLKIDIEAHEYKILDQIIEHARYVSGVAIEFHECETRRDEISRFISEIATHMLVCHVHANNGGEVDAQGDPMTIELSFINRALLDDPIELAPYDLPIPGLDSPNMPNRPDIAFKFAPE